MKIIVMKLAMKKVINTILISAVMLAASALSIAEGNPSLDQQGQANLVIYRAQDRSAMSYRLLVDGKNVGKLSKNAVIELHVEEGEHVIAASDSKRTRLTVVVAAEGVTYVSGDVDKRHRLTLKSVAPDEIAAALVNP